MHLNFVVFVNRILKKHFLFLPSLYINALICVFIYAFTSNLLIGLFVSLANFSLIWRCHHNRWTTTTFDLYSAFMAIEQWEFFNVPHLHNTLYNGHLRGSVTPTCCRAFGIGAVTTRFKDLGLSRPGIEPRSLVCKANPQPLHHRGVL